MANGTGWVYGGSLGFSSWRRRLLRFGGRISGSSLPSLTGVGVGWEAWGRGGGSSLGLGASLGCFCLRGGLGRGLFLIQGLFLGYHPQKDIGGPGSGRGSHVFVSAGT